MNTEEMNVVVIIIDEVNTNPFLATRIKFAVKDEQKQEQEQEQKQKQNQEQEQEEKQELLLGYSLTQLTPDEATAIATDINEDEDENDEDEEKNGHHFQEKTFGILQLDVNTFQQVRKHLDLTIMQDISGSMTDKCKDGRTKMDHTRFTLERILDYMVQNNVDVSVGLMGFDNVVEERIPLQALNSSNIESLTLELNRLKPRNGTNIGKALDHIMPFKQGIDRLFILLTDGQPNDGVTDKKTLKKKVDKILDEDTTVITVGCGVDHDAKLLDFINPGNYYFVDDFEKSGLVCGEFLDKQLNTLLKQVVITVENGEIFSWRENEWVTSLKVTPIVAECNRTYHVRAMNPAEFVIRINAISTKDDLPFVYEVEDKVLEQDLTKFKFRQETLEALNEVRLYNESNIHEIRSGSNGKRIKKSLLDLFKRMKDYMDSNNLRESECEDAKFMRVLCDDVVVAHRTFGTLALSTMYLTARQTSQGEQRTYNVSQEEQPATTYKRNKVQFFEENDDMPQPPAMIARQYTMVMKRMEDDEDEEEEEEELRPPIFLRRANNCLEDDCDDIMSQHQVSDCLSSPYSNLRQVTMMREISSQPEDKK